jgi:DNA-binding transcriptional LysR family regulator
MVHEANVRLRTAKVQQRTDQFNWADVRFFLELCRHKTLSGVARALQVSHVTVARRLEKLEQSLGLTLFNRQADGYELTQDGQVIFDHANAMHEAARAIIDYKLDNPAGSPRVVRITATRTLADEWLVCQLEQLRHDRPDIVLEILTSSRNFSLARGEADIALRLSRPSDGDLVIRKVATLGYAFYATPAYAGAAAEHDLGFIQYEQGSDVPEAVWLETLTDGRPPVLRSNSLLSQKSAAASGLGVALLPRYLGDADARIAPLGLFAEPTEREVWMVMTPRGSRSAHVRAVADDLVAAFDRDRDLFAGNRLAHKGQTSG